jgi:O-antigen ligase
MSNYVEAGAGHFGGGARDESRRMTSTGVTDHRTPLERAAYYLLLAFVASTQFSIAIAGILLTLTGLLWAALVISGRERIDVPRMFWPLAAYAGITLIASIVSVDARISLIDSKQLILFVIIPIVYRLAAGGRSLAVVDVIITVGALNAALGIIQFGILKFDDLGQRPEGNLDYMTYSGVLMLVACTAAARLLFQRQDRLWAALIMPALVVALAATLSRNAWVGACAGIGLLFLMRDFRLFAMAPVLAALFIAVAPATVTERLFSTFQLQPVGGASETTVSSVESNRDRLAMIRSGLRMVKDHPIAGVGPDMVSKVYPQYRDPQAVNQSAAHLHNVPLQIAAERGIPALIIWLWFMFTLMRDFLRMWKRSSMPSLPAAGLAAVVATIAAGMFEYNFGDSEFLMLFLVLVTLPYAADRASAGAASVVSPQRAA